MDDNHEGLDQFKTSDQVNTTPLLKDLYQHITPKYATQWRVIGTLLGLPVERLDIIEHDHVFRAERCCNAMLEKWLQMDTTASWGKLFTVIQSPAVSCSVPATLLTSKLNQLLITDHDKGAEAVAILSNRVSQIDVQTRFMDDNTWPPEQPKSFTPLLLIHRQDQHTPEEVAAMAELMCTGDIGKAASVTGDQSTTIHAKLDSHKKFQKVLQSSKATTEIKEILGPLEEGKESSFILIEGAPGIGKSVLLHEIAYKRANKELLQMFELVLLVRLRDPFLHKVETVDDLLQLFCRGDKNATEIVSACAKYLHYNCGKSLTLLVDGYDEFPEHLRESSLIANILKRQVLPLCGLVVSSRPHASEHLRKWAAIRVDILGFTETAREHYIKQALPDKPHKIKELTQYLAQQPSVDSICFIPFNMVILLYLYKLGYSLPKNPTELYHHFICSTICRHLSKFNDPLTHNITDLTNLPQPCNRIIQQLSKLSLQALNSNKLIFTLDEIRAVCPDITAIPGAINGFGLLQAVQHFGLHAKTMTLNFIHFTIQEFLAAHYISHLPPHEELEVIKASFLNDIHLNMFSMYISLTKGQRSSFKTFLSGGRSGGFLQKVLHSRNTTVSNEFLKDQLKCLRLYRCFNEANDHKICKSIKQADIFKSKEIKLGGITLTASDIECIALFLTSSEWKWLNLTGCHIQDKGLNILWYGLRQSSDVTITKLWLDVNGLTTLSSSLISELTVKCKVKTLVIDGNNSIGEEQQLYSMLTNPSSVLERLYMYGTQLSPRGATQLFTALKDNNKLKELYLDDNAITDDASDAIIMALERNSCLVILSIYGNPLSNEAIIHIAQCLEVNNTLQVLRVSECHQSPQVYSLEKTVNEKRESRGCQVKFQIKFWFAWL